jgi:hypothetical protein
MEQLTLFLCAALGVLISIVLPLLRAILPKPKTLQILGDEKSFWEQANPYLVTGLFSLISGVLIWASFGAEIDFKSAIIAGYAWDSTLQKLRGAN